MNADNIVLDKRFDFAVRIITHCKYLQSQRKDYDLSKIKNNFQLPIVNCPLFIGRFSMLYYVSGPVAVLEPGLAVIDCGGVGYG